MICRQGGMDKERKEAPHKCPGNDCRRTSNQNIHKGKGSKIHTSPSGQYHSPALHSKQRGDTKSEDLIAIAKRIWQYLL